MNNTIWTMLVGLMVVGSAHAQDFTIHGDWLIEPQAGTFYENGLGSPSVQYDVATDTYVMFFETRKYPVKEGCPGGGWVIGSATSNDGVNWSNFQEVLEPTDGTYYSCVAAHPAVVKDGNTWKVWFKANQKSDACASATPAWGCAADTGVGYMYNDGSGWQVSAAPAVPVTGFGFPAVTKVGNTWHMLLAKVPDIYHATSADGVNWSGLTAGLTAGFTLWTDDRAFNPAVVCEDIDTRHKMTVFMGGKDLLPGDDPNAAAQVGWGVAVTEDGEKWFVGASPKFAWVASGWWSHWDAMRVGDNDYIVYFAERDANNSNKNRIGLAYTNPTWDESRIATRVCP